MNNVFDEFTNLFSKSITLRFALLPMGKTEETIKNEKYKDEKRYEAYPIVKGLLDTEYRRIIQEALEELANREEIDWSRLSELIINDEKNSVIRENEEERIRKEISIKLKQHKDYKSLFGKNPFGKNGFFEDKILSDQEKEAIALFNGFSVFLTNFYQNRENFFSSGNESTAIANRIVNENFPKYCCNVEKISVVRKNAPDFWNILEERFCDIPEWTKLFTINGYNRTLTQEGIESYNQLVGMYNSEANLYMQQHVKDLPDGHVMKTRRNWQLMSLFKQIASERTSFIGINKFTTDKEVLQSIIDFRTYVDRSGLKEKLNQLIIEEEGWSRDGIYISSKSTSEVSAFIAKGKWNIIDDALQLHMNLKSNKNQYSFNEIQFALDEINLIHEDETKDEKYFVNDWFRKLQNLLAQMEEVERKVDVFLKTWNPKFSLKEERIDDIKEYFDLWIQVIRFCKCFQLDDKEINVIQKDEDFYAIIQHVLYDLDDFNELYNMLRNYVTQKPYSIDKMHLKFDNPTFANGWAIDKEREYGTFLLRREGKYYLAVINSHKNKIAYETTKKGNESSYEKIVYMQFSDVKKMIPKCSTQLKAVKEYFQNEDSDYILTSSKFLKPLIIKKCIYELNNVEYEGKKKWQKDYLRKTGDVVGYEQAVKQWIEFCMEFLKVYKNTADYDYSSVLPLEKYESVSDFYLALDKILYRIEYEYVEMKEIDRLVESGSLMLFQIYNKDFSENRKNESKKNLHTLYWEALFSEENLRQGIIKLNGGAELFLRKPSIKNAVKHSAGEVVVNKWTKDKKPIPSGIYMDLCNYINGRNDMVNNPDEMKMYLENEQVSYKELKYDLVKDKRYTREHFEFHVPITINYKADNMQQLNIKVLQTLKKNTNVNIIGLDRGERNLISYVVINQEGKVLEQGSFNNVKGLDYQEKLYQREKERDLERKSWNTIESIKELKEGYISQVVYSLTQLMIKYNAVIVMEDLNYGFKRGRFKVERQVYQKFEMALIKKLQYLVTDKLLEIDSDQMGSVLHGYQLAGQPKSLKEVGKQCGFIFYVPPAFTSKIDPITGFVDVFNMTNITNRSTRKSFFEKFNGIFYDEEMDIFGFAFDYKNFDTYQKCARTSWTVYSNDGRYVWNKNARKEEYFEPKKELKELFDFYQIDYRKDLFDTIKLIPDSMEFAEFWKRLDYCFRVMLKLRNTSTSHHIDQIISPVMYERGKFFVTSKCSQDMNGDTLFLEDADTNGAYHIALKGLYILSKNLKKDILDDKKRIASGIYQISNSDWFEYRQKG